MKLIYLISGCFVLSLPCFVEALGGIAPPLFLLPSSLILFLTDLTLKQKEYDISGEMSEQLIRRAIASATHSVYYVSKERYLSDHNGKDREALSRMLRGYPQLENSESKGYMKINLKGRAPSAAEVAVTSSLNARIALSQIRSSIETKASILQALSFFLPVMLLIFASHLVSDPVQQFYVASDYYFSLDIMRKLVMPKL